MGQFILGIALIAVAITIYYISYRMGKKKSA
jgi:hypothetical protein